MRGTWNYGIVQELDSSMMWKRGAYSGNWAQRKEVVKWVFENKISEVETFFEIDILIVTMGSGAKDQVEEKVIRDVLDPFQPYIFSCLSLVYRTMLIFVFVLVSDGLTKQSN